jgi:hypothetical protein
MLALKEGNRVDRDTTGLIVKSKRPWLWLVRPKTSVKKQINRIRKEMGAFDQHFKLISLGRVADEPQA